LLAAFLLLTPQISSLLGRLSCSFQVQQEEAINVEFGKNILRGETIYPDVTQGGPFLMCSYPPLFPFLESILMRWIPGIWYPGRCLAFLGYLGCGLLLGWVLWKRSGSWRWSALTASVFFLFPTWILWGTMARMDAFLHFINFAAFVILWQGAASKAPAGGNRYLWPFAAAGGLNALAIIMKPTAATLALSFGLYALLTRLKKPAFVFYVFLLVPLGLWVALIQWKTQGLYWSHTMKWTAANFDWPRLTHFLTRSFLPEAGWLLALIAAALWLGKVDLLLKCRLLMACFSLLSLSREFGAENYYMEFLLYGLLAAGEGLSSWDGRKNWPVPAFALLLGFYCLSRFSPPILPSAAEMEMKARMTQLYRTGERHLALDMDLPLMAGQKIWYQPTGVMAMYHSGRWNPEPLLRDIREKKFSTVELYDIPEQYLYPPEAVAEIWKNYRVIIRQYGRIWLVPKAT